MHITHQSDSELPNSILQKQSNINRNESEKSFYLEDTYAIQPIHQNKPFITATRMKQTWRHKSTGRQKGQKIIDFDKRKSLNAMQIKN